MNRNQTKATAPEYMNTTHILILHERGKARHRAKRNADVKYKEHLKALSEDLANTYPTPAYYKKKTGVSGGGSAAETGYYKRLYKGNHKGSSYAFYKREANRAVRRYQDDLSSGCEYKKLYDLWWDYM